MRSIRLFFLLFFTVITANSVNARSEWEFETCDGTKEICRVALEQFKPNKLLMRKTNFSSSDEVISGALLLEYSGANPQKLLVFLSKSKNKWLTTLYLPTTGRVTNSHLFPPPDLSKYPLICVQAPFGAQLIRTFDLYYEVIRTLPQEKCGG